MWADDRWAELGGHVRRFFRGFYWAISPSEVAHARRVLTHRELLLFAGLQGRERRHAMDMFEWLRTRAEPSDDLLAAALVHNVGKGSIHLHERVAYVVLDRVSPGLVDRLVNRDLSESIEGSRILRDQLGVAGVYVEQKRQLGKRELKRMFELPKTRKEKLR